MKKFAREITATKGKAEKNNMLIRWFLRYKCIFSWFIMARYRPVEARLFPTVCLAVQKKGSFSELLRQPLSKLLTLAMILTALSQFSGINGVIFYGPTIMKSAGIVTTDALMYQVLLGVANLLFTLIAIVKVDSWGRRWRWH